MYREKQSRRIVERLRDFLADVGPLHTINGFGLGLSPGDLAALKQSQDWKVVDLRDAQGPEQLKALAEHWNEKVLLIVVEGEPERPLHLFVKGMIDKRKRFDLGDGVVRARRDDQTVVMVFPGAKSLEDVSDLFYEIPYWEPEPD